MKCHFSLLADRLGLLIVGLHLNAMSSIAQHETNYKILRSAYDLAFQHLALEVQHLDQLKAQERVEGSRLIESEERVASAHRCYVRRRNELVDYLLSKRAESRITQPAADPISEDQAELFALKERAYFLWENSGRPGGNDQANWYKAEARCS